MTISLEPPLHDFAELDGKIFMIKEMMNAKARSGRFRGVSWTNAFSCCPDAIKQPVNIPATADSYVCMLPGASKLDFFQSVHNLVEIENEVCTIR